MATAPAEPKKEKDIITLVAPNGAQHEERYHGHQTVGHVLEKGVEYFGKQGALDPSGHYILVYGDTPLDNALTLAQAQVPPGSTLKIRSRAIPGDGTCTRN